MQVPVCSRHRLQDRAQRLAGMWETLVMGSIFSGQPILTCRGKKGKTNNLSLHLKGIYSCNFIKNLIINNEML